MIYESIGDETSGIVSWGRVFVSSLDIGVYVQRHEKLVAEVEAWRRRELLKEQMLIQLSKLQSVEKQRHHFQGRFSAPSHAFLLVLEYL